MTAETLVPVEGEKTLREEVTGYLCTVLVLLLEESFGSVSLGRVLLEAVQLLLQFPIPAATAHDTQPALPLLRLRRFHHFHEWPSRGLKQHVLLFTTVQNDDLSSRTVKGPAAPIWRFQVRISDIKW